MCNNLVLHGSAKKTYYFSKFLYPNINENQRKSISQNGHIETFLKSFMDYFLYKLNI